MSPHPRDIEKAYEADDDAEHLTENEERKEDENEHAPPTSTSTLMRVQRRKRKRRKARRHNEIDLSSTSHISSCQFQQMQSSSRQKGPVSLLELSRSLVEIFDNRHYWEAYYPRKLERETEKQDQDNDDDDEGRPSKKSRKSFVIEEALSLSTKARLLIEAKRPHRVVHASAAYSHLLRPQHPTKTITPYNNLEAAIQSMFEDLPVSIHPVWASEGCVVTHYLVEFAGKESLLQRFALHSNSGEPAQMVG